jgi:hypothetical protein
LACRIAGRGDIRAVGCDESVANEDGLRCGESGTVEDAHGCDGGIDLR